jgi:DnaK suppressor protein
MMRPKLKSMQRLSIELALAITDTVEEPRMSSPREPQPLTVGLDASPMSAEAAQQFKETLEFQRDELLVREAELRTRLAAEGETATPNAFVAGAQGGASTESDDEVIAMLRHDEQMLQAVTTALDRVERGRYGLCEACGQAIESARLKALPHVALCLDCQAESERRQGT